MKVYVASTDYHHTFLIAALSLENAYQIACDQNMGYIDFDSVRELTYGIKTDVEHEQILDEF